MLLMTDLDPHPGDLVRIVRSGDRPDYRVDVLYIFIQHDGEWYVYFDGLNILRGLHAYLTCTIIQRCEL